MNASTIAFIAKLRRMRSLLHRGWTQGAMARTARGAPVGHEERAAACWCLLGAAYRAGLTNWAFVDGTRLIAVPYWNDARERTKAEVLAVIDNSIAALETKN
jgi:hypothetical protein